MGEPKDRNIREDCADSMRLYLNDLRRDAELIDGDREKELAYTIRAAIEAQEILQTVAADPNISIASLTDLSQEVLEQVLRDGYEAREEFITANLRLVVDIAKKFTGSGVDQLELIQEGNIALKSAVDNFDPERGNKFSTYAYARIFRSMQTAVANYGRTIRITYDEHKKVLKYKRVQQQVKSEHPYLSEPEIRRVCADRLYCSVDDILELEFNEWFTSNPRSIDAPFGDEGSGLSLADVVGSEDQAFEALHEVDFSLLTEGLNERDAELLRLRICENMLPYEVASKLLE